MKILLIDDHALFRQGLRLLLGRLPTETLFLEADSCEAALVHVEQHHHLDLAILDLTLPGMNGLEGVSVLRSLRPRMPIVLLSASENPQLIVDGMRRGAQGFIPKSASPDVIWNALQIVLAGGSYLPASGVLGSETFPPVRGNPTLTSRQREVLQGLVQGKSNKEIADTLGMRVNTVRVHVAAILKVLEVGSRVEAAKAALKLGLVRVDAL